MSEPDVNNTTRILTANAGNGLAASQNIPEGSLIIKISNPYLTLLEKAHLDSTCSWCFTKPENSTLKNCGGCKVVRYCSSDCQKKDWQAIHKKECKILKTSPDVLPTPTRGLLQLALRHKFRDEPDPKWEGLVMNKTQLIEAGRYDELTLQSMIAAKYSGRGDRWVFLGAQVLCQMSSNAFRVTLPDDTPIGLCFEPTLALANHSCSPNAVVVFDGRAISFRALSDIKKGEEIRISYIENTQTRENRGAELEHRYFFTCQCEKCFKDETAYQTFLRLGPQIVTSPPDRLINMLIDPTSLPKNATSCLDSYNKLSLDPQISQALNSGQNSLDAYLKSSTDSPPSERLSFLRNLCSGHFFGIPAIAPSPAVQHNIFLIHLDNQSWIPALIFLLSLALHTDPYNYPAPHHLVRVVRIFTIAKLFKFLSTLSPPEFVLLLSDQDIETRDSIQKIVPLLDFMDVLQVLMAIVSEEVGKSHGVGSRFAKEIEAEVEDLREGRKMAGGRKSGEALERWLVDRRNDEGAKAAKRVVQVLWALANCVKTLVGVNL
ncbi:SET domain-containing protein [Mollisia scopiformis]|uniref:SET domain-containing protein n=1 Tax=Mollisia scopiformis TaxID=149040 RepID=A0A194WUF0_MOLSC|nr:SET domain-containing protein [Mollisia scopiformis]KUJ11294.1 SET domain-containing protein [Mollisia scopiformis]